MPPENFKMKKFENIEVLSYNIYIRLRNLYRVVSQLASEPDYLSGDEVSTTSSVAKPESAL